MSFAFRKKISLFSYLPIFVIGGICFAGMVQIFMGADRASSVYLAVIFLGTLPYAYRVLRDLIRGHFGVDVLALLAIIAAAALSQFLTASVILFMLAGGEALEEYALSRARLKLTNLLSRAPSIAHRKNGQKITDVPVARIEVGDLCLIKPGETIPVDGIIIEGASSIDESMLTGEPLPAEKKRGQQVSSGSINQGEILVIRTLRVSKESRYEQIVELVRNAEMERAPIVRLADSYSITFTLTSLALAVFAYLISHDPLRVLAVLVVATPCPLIIATPVAIMSGISFAASRGIIVKNGGALETLSRVRAFIFDKTGTITFGELFVTNITAFHGTKEEVMHVAASLDQMSAHILAHSLVHAAHEKKVELDLPTQFHETIGEGVKGKIGSKVYSLGRYDYIHDSGAVFTEETLKEYKKRQGTDEKIIFLAQGKQVIGSIAFADRIRPETKHVFDELQYGGKRKLFLLSGDRSSVVQKAAKLLGIKNVLGDLHPEDKVKELRKIRATNSPIAMIGDGVNDAPALALADVGIAMGARGGTVASETADIVITVDSLGRVEEAVWIAERMMRVAKQGIFFGIGVSVALMVIASLGGIPAFTGSFLQEGLDVVVILGALRVHAGQRSMKHAV